MNTYFRNPKAIVGVAIVGLVLASLSCRLDGAAAKGCNLLDKVAWVALEALRSVILAGWQPGPAYLYEHSGCLQHLLQILTSISPLLCVMVA